LIIAENDAHCLQSRNFFDGGIIVIVKNNGILHHSPIFVSVRAY